MKKLLTIILLVLLVSGLVFANGEQEGTTKKDNNLVLITSTAADNINAVVPAFEEKYGIKVDLITGSTGEVFSRIQAESANPSCDITWIGEYYVLNSPDLFEEYVSSNDSQYPEGFRNKSGLLTATNGTAPVIMWNKEMVPEGISSYKDLLNPELQGKIAFGDAATSSSAYNHLENMLIDFGDGDVFAEEGWDFVKQLLTQLNGKVVNSSSVTYKGVVSGEYAVGLSWDAPALQLINSETSNVGFCYMEEGSASKVSGIAIMKNCNNLENAKLFVDFISSQEGQELLANNSAGANPIRTDIEFPEYKQIMKTANIFSVDAVWSSTIKAQVQEKFTDLFMDYVE